MATTLALLTLAPVRAPAVAATRVMHWGAIGNSITYGIGTSDCIFVWDAPYCSDHAYPRVAGVPSIGKPGQGLTISGYWPPLTATFSDELSGLAAQGVNGVVVEAGINDVIDGRTTMQQYKAAYRKLEQIGAEHGMVVVLSTLTPFGAERRGVTGAMQTQRRRINSWIRNRSKPFVEYAKALGGNVLLPRYDSGDGLHPDDSGHAKMARVLESWIVNHATWRASTWRARRDSNPKPSDP